MRRISIKTIMGYVLFIAVGLAALRNASEAWAGVMLALTLGTLGASVLLMIERRGRERAWWRGFSLFASAYFVLTFVPIPWFSEIRATLPTTHLLNYLTIQALPTPSPVSRTARLRSQLRYEDRRLQETDPGDPSYELITFRRTGIANELAALGKTARTAGRSAAPPTSNRLQRVLLGIDNPAAFRQIGHCLSALLAGVVGAVISSRIYREPSTVA